jgi:hypothetical protein
MRRSARSKTFADLHRPWRANLTKRSRERSPNRFAVSAVAASQKSVGVNNILQEALARLECLSLQHEEVLDNRAERQNGEILQEIDD